MPRTATALWHLDRDLVLALDEHLGLPVDSYVNGTQTWLTEIDADTTLEWRLHPVAGYRTPEGLSHYDVWEQVVGTLTAGLGTGVEVDVDALDLGGERRALATLWDGLECYVAIGDDLEPAVLVHAVAAVLPVAPVVAGLVDHDRIGAVWERSDGAISIVDLLVDELRSEAT